MLIPGVGDCAPLEAMKPAPSKQTLLRAAFHLQAQGASDAGELVFKHANKRFPGSRGRSAPKAGDVREYKVQKESKSKSEFLRIPPSVLTLIDTQKVRAEFSPNRIVLTPGSVPEPKEK